MGLREMQDMETQLTLRGGGRHDNQPAECCPECTAAQRVSLFSQLPREDRGVLAYRSWWERVSPWVQVAAVWGVLVWLVLYMPHQARELAQWLSQ